MPSALVPLQAEAWGLIESLLKEGAFPLELTIVNSRIERAEAGGRDLTPDLARLSNEKLEITLIEVAVSNNPGVNPTELDWGINSVLNEAAPGIPVAVGEGVTGAHLDFICPGVRLVAGDPRHA